MIKEDEQLEVDEKGDENILEKLKNARMTHQKFFDILSGRMLQNSQSYLLIGKNKGQRDDDEEVEEDEGQEPRNFLIKIDEDLVNTLDYMWSDYYRQDSLMLRQSRHFKRESKISST